MPVVRARAGLAPRVSRAPVVLTQIAPTVLHFLDQPIGGRIAGCSLLSSEAALAQCATPVSSVRGLRGEAFDDVLDEPLRTLADLERRQTDIERWQRFAPR